MPSSIIVVDDKAKQLDSKVTQGNMTTTHTSAPAPAPLQMPNEPRVDTRLLEPADVSVGPAGQNVSHGNSLTGMTMAQEETKERKAVNFDALFDIKNNDDSEDSELDSLARMVEQDCVRMKAEEEEKKAASVSSVEAAASAPDKQM